MKSKMLIDKIIKKMDAILNGVTQQGQVLWQEILDMHPADSAQICMHLDNRQLEAFFLKLPKNLQLDVFEELPNNLKANILHFLDDTHKAYILKHISIDDITDIFDELSDEDLKKNLDVLHKKDRQKVLALLQFPPDSAGGIMTIDMLTFMQDSTVTQAIMLLQRIRPNMDLHRQIYVTDQTNKLVGYINLEDLLSRSPQRRLIEMLKPVPYVARVEEDQEEIAKQMMHYHMMSVPVVNEDYYLLGVIPEDKLIDIIKQEASEDAQRMSGVPVMTSYFEIPFFQLLYHRSFILAFLLILESITSVIVHRYESVLNPFFMMFFAMLVSTGGNTSGQTSAIAIQGMSSGDINASNVLKFLRREILLGLLLATSLSIVSFVRVYAVHQELMGSLIVSCSLGLIVFLSVLLGASFPLFLQRLGLDPAFSAGPLLATLMDILGIFIYCYVIYLVLT